MFTAHLWHVLLASVDVIEIGRHSINRINIVAYSEWWCKYDYSFYDFNNRSNFASVAQNMFTFHINVPQIHASQIQYNHKNNNPDYVNILYIQLTESKRVLRHVEHLLCSTWASQRLNLREIPLDFQGGNWRRLHLFPYCSWCIPWNHAFFFSQSNLLLGKQNSKYQQSTKYVYTFRYVQKR